MKNKFTEVKICLDSMEAQLIRSLLESEDIDVQMNNVNMHDLFPGTGLINIKIFVPENNKEKALKLIKDFYEDKD